MTTRQTYDQPAASGTLHRNLYQRWLAPKKPEPRNDPHNHTMHSNHPSNPGQNISAGQSGRSSSHGYRSDANSVSAHPSSSHSRHRSEPFLVKPHSSQGVSSSQFQPAPHSLNPRSSSRSRHEVAQDPRSYAHGHGHVDPSMHSGRTSRAGELGSGARHTLPWSGHRGQPRSFSTPSVYRM